MSCVDKIALKPGKTLLNNSYRIECVLGSGGFGITYLAYDINLERRVAIKEFFPKNFCDRNLTTSHMTIGTAAGREFITKMKGKFLKEARRIIDLVHPNIIKVYTAFQENDTAYYVMEYIEGGSLSERVKKSGPLSVDKALHYIKGVGEALSYVHSQQINHLDVKPGNIMVRKADDSPILIDFGISKQYDSDGNQTSTTPVGVSHGYAPVEQYKSGGVKSFSPQTDVYSLAATLYFLLTGNTPPDAMDLTSECELAFPEQIPTRLIPAISKAMSMKRADRYPSVADFINALDNPTAKPSDSDATEIAESSTAQTFILTGNPVIDRLVANMVRVEGGYFNMGSDDSEAYSDEKPVHQEYVSSFYIGKYEVTQAEWKEVMGTNPSYFKDDNKPVENVSWNDCQKFIEKLNKMTGKNFRLPTEAEWEYAARGGNKSRGYKYSGSNDIDSVAWYWDNSGNTTHDVGTKQANELGLYDMSGNVYEWTSYLWCDNYNSARNGGSSGSFRVIRGGGWCLSAVNCRVSLRGSGGPSDRDCILGLRLAL